MGLLTANVSEYPNGYIPTNIHLNIHLVFYTLPQAWHVYIPTSKLGN